MNSEVRMVMLKGSVGKLKKMVTSLLNFGALLGAA